MARKKQKGLSYFPFDINFFDDKKIEMINAEFGVKGENIAIRLLCSIYKNGYWEKYDDDTNLLIAKRVGNGVTSSLVSEVVNGLVRRSFFNKGVFDQFSILTSKGIQERFFEAIERRKTVEIIPEIMLIDINATFNTKNVTFLPLNVALIGQNAGISTQTKLNKTKQDETKGEETIPPAPIASEPKPPKTESEEIPPLPAAPPLDERIGAGVPYDNDVAMREISLCYEIYWSDTYKGTRDIICQTRGMPPERLKDWTEAFNRMLLSDGKRGKTMEDYTSHFSRWMNQQIGKGLTEPKKLFSSETGTTKNGQQADRHADYANDLARRLRENIS